MSNQKTQKSTEKRNESLQHSDTSRLRENYQRGVVDSNSKKGYTPMQGSAVGTGKDTKRK